MDSSFNYPYSSIYMGTMNNLQIVPFIKDKFVLLSRGMFEEKKIKTHITLKKIGTYI